MSPLRSLLLIFFSFQISALYYSPALAIANECELLFHDQTTPFLPSVKHSSYQTSQADKKTYAMKDGNREIQVILSRGVLGDRTIDIVKSPFALPGEIGVNMDPTNLQTGYRLWKKLIATTRNNGGDVLGVIMAFAKDSGNLTSLVRTSGYRVLGIETVIASGWFEAVGLYAEAANIRLTTDGLKVGWWRVIGEGRSPLNRVASHLKELRVSLYLGPLSKNVGLYNPKNRSIYMSDDLLFEDPLKFSSSLIHEMVHAIIDLKASQHKDLILYTGQRYSPDKTLSIVPYDSAFRFDEILAHATGAIFNPFHSNHEGEISPERYTAEHLKREIKTLIFYENVLNQFNLRGNHSPDNKNPNQAIQKVGVLYAFLKGESHVKLNLGELYFEPSSALKEKLLPYLDRDKEFKDLRELNLNDAFLAEECLEEFKQQIQLLLKSAGLAIAALEKSEQIRIELQKTPKPPIEVIEEMVSMLKKIDGMPRLLELLQPEIIKAIVDSSI